MTEEEWLQSREPISMLGFLHRSASRRASRRKLKLLVYAVFSRVAHLYEGWKAGEKTIDLIENFADGQAINTQLRGKPTYGPVPKRPLDAAYFYCEQARVIVGDSVLAGDRELWDKWNRAFKKANLHPEGGSLSAYGIADSVAPREWLDRGKMAGDEETKSQADLVREIFGNPFRPVRLNPRWSTSTVAEIARKIYDERKYDLFPILADALEDAGCDSAEMIAHLRGGGPHVRGCWVLDLILDQR